MAPSKRNSRPPDTSMEAYKSAKKFKTDHHAVIIKALKILRVASPEQISSYTRLDYFQVSRRMSELERLNIAYRPGKKVMTARGRAAYVWKLCKKDQEARYVQPDLFFQSL